MIFKLSKYFFHLINIYIEKKINFTLLLLWKINIKHPKVKELNSFNKISIVECTLILLKNSKRVHFPFHIKTTITSFILKFFVPKYPILFPNPETPLKKIRRFPSSLPSKIENVKRALPPSPFFPRNRGWNSTIFFEDLPRFTAANKPARSRSVPAFRVTAFNALEPEIWVNVTVQVLPRHRRWRCYISALLREISPPRGLRGIPFSRIGFTMKPRWISYFTCNGVPPTLHPWAGLWSELADPLLLSVVENFIWLEIIEWWQSCKWDLEFARNEVFSSFLSFSFKSSVSGWSLLILTIFIVFIVYSRGRYGSKASWRVGKILFILAWILPSLVTLFSLETLLFK